MRSGHGRETVGAALSCGRPASRTFDPTIRAPVAGSSGLASIKHGSTGEDKISIRICWPAGGRAQERRAPTASRPCHDRRTAHVARVNKHEMSELFMDKPLPLSALPVKPVRFVAKLAQRNTLAP